MEEGRTTTHDEGYGKRIVNLGLGWMEMQHGGEAKGKKKLPRSGLVQLLIIQRPPYSTA
jgi:hypothetical protein